MPTLAHELAAYSRALTFDALPPEVVHEVKRRRIALAARCEPGATVLGTGQRTTPDLAAFANGAMVRYLDYNDTYLSLEPAHPSDNIPAALAVAEARGRSGRDFITAVVLAYEV